MFAAKLTLTAAALVAAGLASPPAAAAPKRIPEPPPERLRCPCLTRSYLDPFQVSAPGGRRRCPRTTVAVVHKDAGSR